LWYLQAAVGAVRCYLALHDAPAAAAAAEAAAEASLAALSPEERKKEKLRRKKVCWVVGGGGGGPERGCRLVIRPYRFMCPCTGTPR